MSIEERNELKLELGLQNKDFIMKFLYNPIAKFLSLNQVRYKAQLAMYGAADLKKIPTKDEMLRLVFEFYTDQEIATGFVESYNERDRIIINKAVWEGGLNRAALETLFEKTIVVHLRKGYYSRVELISEVKAAWGDYTAIIEPSGYYGDAERLMANTDLVLSFPLPLRKLLASQLPKPQGHQFEPIAEPGDHFKLFLTESTIFNEFPRIVAYHGQGNIKYSQKGNPNQASAKKISKALKIVEFGGEYEFPIRSLLIAGLLGEDFKMKIITESPHQIVRKLFSVDFDRKQVAPYMLTHLKGLSRFHWHEYRPKTTDSILQVFKQLPQGEWVTLENLKTFVMTRFLAISPLRDWMLRDRVHVEYENHDDDGRGKWEISLHSGNTHQFVWEPYIAGHVYLLAAFGLMDIAIDPAINNGFTVYDSLFALRLTSLGAYVLGLNKEYIPPVRGNETSLSFDENSPIIRIEGDVVLGDTLLSNYATRVSENRYQFSHGKFLKECKSTKDIQNKIALFKQTIGQKLPLFWENYLQELVGNSKSVVPQSKVKVFTIPPENKVLQRIIVQDEILRKLVIKGEQYHLLVMEANLPAFINRMKELGYVIG